MTAITRSAATATPPSTQAAAGPAAQLARSLSKASWTVLNTRAPDTQVPKAITEYVERAGGWVSASGVARTTVGATTYWKLDIWVSEDCDHVETALVDGRGRKVGHFERDGGALTVHASPPELAEAKRAAAFITRHFADEAALRRPSTQRLRDDAAPLPADAALSPLPHGRYSFSFEGKRYAAFVEQRSGERRPTLHVVDAAAKQLLGSALLGSPLRLTPHGTKRAFDEG